MVERVFDVLCGAWPSSQKSVLFLALSVVAWLHETKGSLENHFSAELETFCYRSANSKASNTCCSGERETPFSKTLRNPTSETKLFK